MIHEEYIDKAVVALEQNGAATEQFFVENQEDFVQYLNEELFKVFTEEEAQLLLFLLTVIHQAHHIQYGETITVDLDAFNKSDDNNWKQRESCKNWTQAKDAFFDNTVQEDALAFVEDMLADDDEDKIVISDAVEEIIFITAKSFIDTITATS